MDRPLPVTHGRAGPRSVLPTFLLQRLARLGSCDQQHRHRPEAGSRTPRRGPPRAALRPHSRRGCHSAPAAKVAASVPPIRLSHSTGPWLAMMRPKPRAEQPAGGHTRIKSTLQSDASLHAAPIAGNSPLHLAGPEALAAVTLRFSGLPRGVSGEKVIAAPTGGGGPTASRNRAAPSDRRRSRVRVRAAPSRAPRSRAAAG